MGQERGLLENRLLHASLHWGSCLERAWAAETQGCWNLAAPHGRAGSGTRGWTPALASPAGEVGQGDEDDTKLGGVGDMPDVGATIWKDLTGCRNRLTGTSWGSAQGNAKSSVERQRCWWDGQRHRGLKRMGETGYITSSWGRAPGWRFAEKATSRLLSAFGRGGNTNVGRSRENVLDGNSQRKVWMVALLQPVTGHPCIFCKGIMGISDFLSPHAPGSWEGDLQREQGGHKELFKNSGVYIHKGVVWGALPPTPPTPPPSHCSHFSSCKHLFSFKKLLADGWWGCSQVIVAKPAPGLVHYRVIMALHLLVCYSIIVLFSESAYWPE